MPLPDGYLAMLDQLALAFTDYRERTGFQAILVGGAATALYTDGEFPSADFDVVASNDQVFAEAMLARGFQRERGVARFLGSYFHPEHPEYSVETVSGPLFDGRTDWKRLLTLKFKRAGRDYPAAYRGHDR